MNGKEYLLDTNVIIGLLKGLPEFEELYRGTLSHGAVSASQISRIELLSFPDITVDEETTIREFLCGMTICPITSDVEAKTIELRRGLNLRLADALITATAMCHGCTLVTHDSVLARKAKSVLTCLSP